MYQAARCLLNAPFGVIEVYPGYLAAVFIDDSGILSALIARASAVAFRETRIDSAPGREE